MSPIAMWIDELDRTPEKFTARETRNGSNEKQEKPKVEVEKVEVAEVEVDVEMDKLKMKNAELEVEVEEYRADLGALRNKMFEIEEHILMMEKLHESNEQRFRDEMRAEYVERERLEAEDDHRQCR